LYTVKLPTPFELGLGQKLKFVS